MFAIFKLTLPRRLSRFPQVGFPMIIKPTSGAGSMGVYKVVDEADLRDKVKQLVSELSGESDAGNNAWIYQYDSGLKAEAPIVAETYVVCCLGTVEKGLSPKR